MTTSSATAVSYLIWAACMVPAVLVAMWLGLVSWSWQGFAVGFVVLAAIALTYDALVRVVERWLKRRRTPPASSGNEC